MYISAVVIVVIQLKIVLAKCPLKAECSCNLASRVEVSRVSLYTTGYKLPPVTNHVENAFKNVSAFYLAKIYWEVNGMDDWEEAPEKLFDVVCNVTAMSSNTSVICLEETVPSTARHHTIKLTTGVLNEARLACAVRARDYCGAGAFVNARIERQIGQESPLQPPVELLVSATDERRRYLTLLVNPEYATATVLEQHAFPQILSFFLGEPSYQNTALTYWYSTSLNQILNLRNANALIEPSAALPTYLYRQPDLRGLPNKFREQLAEAMPRFIENVHSYVPQEEANTHNKLFALTAVAHDWVNRIFYVAGIEPNRSEARPHSVLASWTDMTMTMFTKVLYRSKPGRLIEQIAYCPVANRVYFTERDATDNVVMYAYKANAEESSEGPIMPMFQSSSSCDCLNQLDNVSETMAPAVALDWRRRSYAPNSHPQKPFRILWASTFSVWSSDWLGCRCELVHRITQPDQFWKISTDVYGNLYWLTYLDNGNTTINQRAPNDTDKQSSLHWRLTDAKINETIRLLEIYDFLLLDPVYRPLPQQADSCYRLPRQPSAPLLAEPVESHSATFQVTRSTNEINVKCLNRPMYVVRVYYKKALTPNDKYDALGSKTYESKEFDSLKFKLQGLEPDTDYLVQVLLIWRNTRTFMSNATYFRTAKNNTVDVSTRTAGLLALASVLAAVMLLLSFMWRKERRLRQIECGRRAKIKHCLGNAELKYIPQAALTMQRFLGQGHFGAVYEGLLYDTKTHRTRHVALKALQNTKASEMEFYREAIIMTQINRERAHDDRLCHTVELIGISIDSAEPLLALELMSGGTLAAFLTNYDAGRVEFSVTVSMAVDMCAQIAAGMQALHRLHIVQRDLRAENVLRSSHAPTATLKIADFGLARYVCENDVYLVNAKSDIPVRHTAPEVFPSTEPLQWDGGVVSPQADVWSFGITMWEIFALGALPYADLHSATNVRDFVTTQHGYPGQPAQCPDDMYSMMKRCWSRNPNHRPDFHHLHNELKQAKASLRVRPTNDYVLSGSKACALVKHNAPLETYKTSLGWHRRMNLAVYYVLEWLHEVHNYKSRKHDGPRESSGSEATVDTMLPRQYCYVEAIAVGGKCDSVGDEPEDQVQVADLVSNSMKQRQNVLDYTDASSLSQTHAVNPYSPAHYLC